MSAYLEEIIKKELQVEPDITNVFGLDLTKCLVKPIKQQYDSTDIYEMWTVLEATADENGYKLISKI